MKNVIANKFRKEGMWGVIKAILMRFYLILSVAYTKQMHFQIRLLAAEAISRFKGSINPTVPLDYADAKIIMAADNLMSFYRSNACKKEPETVRWIEENLRPKDVFYDIGANVGAYSLVADKFCIGDITVYAFEPSFSTFNQLCKNIILNDSQKSILPFMVCLSENEKIEILNYFSTDAGDSKHTLGDNYIDCLGEKFSPAYNQKIFGHSIDSLVKRWGFMPPNHIKLDVDGTELQILRGAAETLRNGTVRSILVEIGSLDPSREAIIAFLHQNGFTIDSKIQHGTTVISNYIFKRISR